MSPKRPLQLAISAGLMLAAAQGEKFVIKGSDVCSLLGASDLTQGPCSGPTAVQGPDLEVQVVSSSIAASKQAATLLRIPGGKEIAVNPEKLAELRKPRDDAGKVGVVSNACQKPPILLLPEAPVQAPQGPVQSNPISSGQIGSIGDIVDHERAEERRRSLASYRFEEQGFRTGVVTRARDLVQRYQNNIQSDQRVLSQSFSALTAEQKKEGLLRASKSLAARAKTLESSRVDGMLAGDKMRFVKQLQNASDLAGLRAQAPATSARLGSSSPDSADSAIERQVLLEALPKNVQSKVIHELKLVERPRTLGSSLPVPLVHNGYWLGGAKSGTDCSGFLTQSLPEELRELRLTTLDLKALQELVNTGEFNPPPKYDPERLGKLKKMAPKLEAVDIDQGQALSPGDMLVYRLLEEPIGHVFVVEHYVPQLMRATVYEASQSYGGLRSRDFDLSVDPYDAPKRFLRPGRFGPRIKKPPAPQQKVAKK